MTGHTLSHYQIDAELGRGGMGVVYRATDTRLNRTVALKVLPAAALASPDDRARFVREAQSAAQLHHPNIATVFGIDEAVPEGEGAGGESRLFIAMEYIEGETLREHAQKGPMKLQEAVSIAGQIAEALKEAHAKDIVHRDIKSANIMLTADGVAKVLDFGLAKTNASTMLTRMGSTLGTVAYMSPEQARGEEVDGRSDLYSLGTVLYELIAGRLPFAGDYEQAVLYGILNETPEPLTAIRTGVPMQLEWVVNKLLSKEAEYRYQTAADLLADLKSLDLSGSVRSQRSIPAMSAPRMPTAGRLGRWPGWAWAGAGSALVLAAAVGWLLKPPPPQPEEIVARFRVDLEEIAPFSTVAWTPDETSFYYTAIEPETGRPYLRVYELAGGTSEEVPGTQDARGVTVSADGRWLAFTTTDGEIKRMLRTGGSPTAIPDTDGLGRFGYSDGPAILASGSRAGSAFIDANGRVEWLSDKLSSGSQAHYWSAYERFVYLGTHQQDSSQVRGTWIRGGSAPPVLVAEGYAPGHADGSGTLLLHSIEFERPTAVARVDPASGTISSVVPFVEMVWSAGGLSQSGHLVYQERQSRRRGPEPVQVVEDGLEPRHILTVEGSHGFSLSPDGRFLAMEVAPSVESSRLEFHLVRVDLDTGAQLRLTREGLIHSPIWSPDGLWIYFSYSDDSDSPRGIARHRADGSGTIEPVVRDSSQSFVAAISPDGSRLAYWRFAGGGLEMAMMDLESRDHAVFDSFNTTIVNMGRTDFSPDGRYLAFALQGSRGGSIIVAEVDGPGRIEAIPRGSDPTWSPEGDYLYFDAGDGELRRRAVSTDPVFAPVGGEEVVYKASGRHLHFDLMPDGRVMVAASEDGDAGATGTRTWVMMNFDQFVRDVTVDMN